MRKPGISSLTRGAAVAALYTVLTLLLPFASAGTVEIRFSEALCVLPMLMPEAIPGLAVGCLITNLLHGAVLYDVIFGTLATLLAAVLTRFLREKPLLAALMPALSNGVIVGMVLYFGYQIGFPLYVCMLSVAAGEAVVCCTLGLLLLKYLKKTKLFS